MPPRLLREAFGAGGVAIRRWRPVAARQLGPRQLQLLPVGRSEPPEDQRTQVAQQRAQRRGEAGLGAALRGERRWLPAESARGGILAVKATHCRLGPVPLLQAQLAVVVVRPTLCVLG